MRDAGALTGADGVAYASAADVQAAIEEMRAHFRSGATRAVAARKSVLRALLAYLKAHEAEALEALHADLGKSEFEGYATELGIVYDEIKTFLRHLGSWARPRRVATPLAHVPSVSRVYPAPYGVSLVMSPWNYPLQLALVPVVDALGAGNCVVLKPSRTSRHTTAFLEQLCAEVFDRRLVRCLPSGRAMNGWLLEVDADKIFFTGSPSVGRQIMAAAARDLTPVTLELGGKSPCIVAADAKIDRAAQRIAWGKCINSGQTCVAPDYFLVHEDVVDEFVRGLERHLHVMYGGDILACPWYPHMINERHFDRVCGLIDERGADAQVALGGRRDRATLKIEPTVLTGVGLDDPVMGEEIFGPVLPILTWRTFEDIEAVTRRFGEPLACYVFSESRAFQERVIERLPFGGATINDVVVHLANNHMGFGGVGESGMGSYHGKIGFDCFTHYKSTLRKSTLVEVPVRNAPFDPWKLKIVRLLMG